MARRVEKRLEWKFPLKRLVVGAVLLAAGIGTLVMGWGSALSWLEIGVAMLFLGTALAHVQGGVPRWLATAMVADEDGFELIEARKTHPDTKRETRIPARLIRGVQQANIAGIATRVEVATAFGDVPWTKASKKPEDDEELQELRRLWAATDYDPSEPWVEFDRSAFDVSDNRITWRQPANIQPLGHMIAVLGPAVAAIPLFGKAWGIPFALIAALSLLLFFNSARHAYRFFGYRCRIEVADGVLHFRRPLKHRSIPISEIERINVNTADLGVPWTIEINGGGISEMLKKDATSTGGVLKSLFKNAFRMMRTGWLIQFHEHGAREVVALVYEMHRLTGVPFPRPLPSKHDGGPSLDLVPDIDSD